MQSTYVRYCDGSLKVASRKQSREIPRTAVERIYVCRMEDDLHHGDEPFHLLDLGREFLLVGPFIEGGLGAIEALIASCPTIPVEHRLVRSVPYRLREPGTLGLRAFPVPGLYFRPIADLEHLRLLTPEGGHG